MPSPSGCGSVGRVNRSAAEHLASESDTLMFIKFTYAVAFMCVSFRVFELFFFFVFICERKRIFYDSLFACVSIMAYI